VRANGGRSTIRTRYPQGNYLLTQFRGESLCTLGDSRTSQGVRPTKTKGIVVVPPSGSTTLKLIRELSASGGRRFVAVLRESNERDGPTQFRARLRPGGSFSVAVHRGRLTVVLPGRDTRDVTKGGELRVGLTSQNTIRSIVRGTAHFAAGEIDVFANQSQSWFRLSVDAANGGGSGKVVSGPPAGIDCGTDCAEGYASGTVVTLSATPAANSKFDGWGGACSGTQATCSVTMDAAKTVTATFTTSTQPQLPMLSVSKQGGGAGTVTSRPAGIDCGSDCTEAYASGTVVTLTPTPDQGSEFAGWGGDCTGVTTCSVTMDAAKTVTATFTRQVFTLSVSKEGSGAGTVTSDPAGIDCGSDCAEGYASGTVVTLTATPAANSKFDGWGGACSGTQATCSVTMDAAKTVTATFQPSASSGFDTVKP
jgi:uncharacterized repeat protein (TIGR02543 family)